MTISCDYANPSPDTSMVNYHFDADSMTIYPVDHPSVVAFLEGGGTIAAYITPVPPEVVSADENFNGLESRRSDALMAGSTDDQIAGLALEIAAIKRKIGLE